MRSVPQGRLLLGGIVLSSVNATLTTSLLSLFRMDRTVAAPGPTGAPASIQALGSDRDAASKARNAMGRIAELVSGIGKADALASVPDAERAYAENGEYSETTTVAGTVVPDEEFEELGLQSLREQAKGAGPEAERAKAYLEARDQGTIQRYDMSAMGVTSTLTITNHYYADGRDKGQQATYDTRGMRQFLDNHTVVDADGVLRDRATGNYAGIEQNGTRFTYLVY